ncbi:MAG: hypothetical protein U0228_31880 [Myxococcaceae bacterium]
MAAKRDEWVVQLEQNGLNPALVKTCLDGNAGQLEARMLALCRAKPSPLGAQCAVALFTKFPLRFREQLGTGAAAAGVAWLHGAKASAFAKLKPPKAPNDDVPAWHQAVTRALSLALAHRASPPKPGAKSKQPALPTQGRDALQAAWLEKAKAHSPDDVPELMERFGEGPGTHLTLRALALLSFPTDARIADGLAGFIERPSVRMAAETTVFTVIALAFAMHGDASHRATVEKLTSNVDSLLWLEAALPTKTAPRPKTPAPSRSSVPSDEKSFLAFIAEKPGDDGRVALFQDWLVERNEPRGEFMALQRSARELTPKEAKRVAALQKKHEKAWLGSFGPAMLKGSARFRDGLPREVAVTPWRPSDVPLTTDPVLPLLEALRLEGGTNLPLVNVLSGPWRSLRSLIAADWIMDAAPRALLEQCEALGEMESGAGVTDRLKVFSLELPKLRHVTLSGVSWQSPRSIAALPCLPRLESLTIEASNLTPWFNLAGKVALLRLQTDDLEVPGPRGVSTRHLRFELRAGQPMQIRSEVPFEDRDDFQFEVVEPLKEVPRKLRRGAVLSVPYQGKQLEVLRALL